MKGVCVCGGGDHYGNRIMHSLLSKYNVMNMATGEFATSTLVLMEVVFPCSVGSLNIKTG